MRTLRPTRQFDKDMERLSSGSLSSETLNRMWGWIADLACGRKLPPEAQDHFLVGNYNGCREFHAEPDLIVIYYLKPDPHEMVLIRAGSHSELFSGQVPGKQLKVWKRTSRRFKS